MKPTVRHEIAALEVMTATQLRRRHRDLFGEEPRSGNRQWLFRRCAWRVQALAEGDLTERLARLRAKAMRIANDADMRAIAPRQLEPDPAGIRKTCSVTMREEDRLPLPGTVLERVFKGRRCLVRVLPGGFEYDGQIYRSLSAVAYAISGSHWNGFLFFRDCLNYAKREEQRHG